MFGMAVLLPAQDNPYKDQGEIDLVAAVSKETDPQKKLDKLKEWEQKYPDTKLQANRDEWRANAQLTLAQGLLPKAQAAYGKPGPPDVLDNGQKAAQTIVANMDVWFSPENKKAVKAQDETWNAARKMFGETAHSVLGWVAMTKKDDATTESEFRKVLEIDPAAAQISYSLGSTIMHEKNIQRYSEALFDLARSTTVTGTGALTPEAKKVADDVLKKAYIGYHGDESGLDQLKASAASSALPPAGFHIENVEEIQKKQFASQDAFDKAHPDVALWRQIRDTLKADNGDAYFQSIKGSQIPPENIGWFKGKVVSVGDKSLVVNVDNGAGDATLKFDTAIGQKAIEAGAAFEFKGVVDSLTREPYMLSLSVDDPKAEIKGLPESAFSAAPVRRTPVRKAAPKK